MNTTATLPADITARLTADGWYQAQPGQFRSVGDCYTLGAHAVAVRAIRSGGGTRTGDAECSAKAEQRLLRLATQEELAIADAGRAAMRAGWPSTHPARIAAAQQRARIADTPA